jgi:hypothetical protein
MPPPGPARCCCSPCCGADLGESTGSARRCRRRSAQREQSAHRRRIQAAQRIQTGSLPRGVAPRRPVRSLATLTRRARWVGTLRFFMLDGGASFLMVGVGKGSRRLSWP